MFFLSRRSIRAKAEEKNLSVPRRSQAVPSGPTANNVGQASCLSPEPRAPRLVPVRKYIQLSKNTRRHKDVAPSALAAHSSPLTAHCPRACPPAHRHRHHNHTPPPFPVKCRRVQSRKTAQLGGVLPKCRSADVSVLRSSAAMSACAINRKWTTAPHPLYHGIFPVSHLGKTRSSCARHHPGNHFLFWKCQRTRRKMREYPD